MIEAKVFKPDQVRLMRSRDHSNVRRVSFYVQRIENGAM
jgi:hypothetical protein